MSRILDELLAANAAYAASFGSRSGLARPPRRAFAVLTCMDARLDPAKFLGLTEGDAHILRNAGGRASEDVIGSLLISYDLGTKEWLVIHHTDCGMEFADPHGAVVEEVRRIRNHPLVPAGIPIYGFIYDVSTGRLNEVAEATALGRSS